jgi:dimethylargininase
MSMAIAITRGISPVISKCELTFQCRVPIDLELALAEHTDYERALHRLGFTLLRLESLPCHPDSVFVEDTAIILDEIAVIARPGAPPRREETLTVAEALAAFRLRLVHIQEPGTLDGGDVLRVDRHLFVGQSNRTNEAAITQLREHATPLGYDVRPVPVRGCLHLKSAVTQVGPDTMLINPDFVPAVAFADYRLIEVDPRERHAANALLAGEAVLYSDAFPHTTDRLLAERIDVRPLRMTEIAKAEGGVTCCSLLIA